MHVNNYLNMYLNARKMKQMTMQTRIRRIKETNR